MEQLTLKNVNNYLNANIYSYFETPGGQSFNLYFNAVHFLTQVWELDICGSLRLLFSCIDVLYVLFYWNIFAFKNCSATFLALPSITSFGHYIKMPCWSSVGWWDEAGNTNWRKRLSTIDLLIKNKKIISI